MISRWQWIYTQLSRKLWIKSAGFALLGVVIAAAGTLAEHQFPNLTPLPIRQGATQSILNILASSMLAVTTFSLSIMVTAFSGASNVSPRATDLLMADQTSHNILAIFIGAFLFSLAGLILLNLGFYNEKDEFVLFIVSIAMVIAVVIAILRWVDHLTKFGRMGDTINRLETVTLSALEDRLANPYLGGTPKPREPNEAIKHHPIFAADIGYIEFFDIAELHRLAEHLDTTFIVDALPGAFIHHGAPLAFSASPPDEDTLAKVRDSFVISHRRNFLQDPRFGIAVMTEVATRGLSNAISDSGTTIDLLGRMVRILSQLAERETATSCDILYPRVIVPGINLGEYFDDFFIPVARDAGDTIEVHMRLHKALNALESLGDKGINQQVERTRERALAYAKNGLRLESDFSLVSAIANATQPR